MLTGKTVLIAGAGSGKGEAAYMPCDISRQFTIPVSHGCREEGFHDRTDHKP